MLYFKCLIRHAPFTIMFFFLNYRVIALLATVAMSLDTVTLNF